MRRPQREKNRETREPPSALTIDVDLWVVRGPPVNRGAQTPEVARKHLSRRRTQSWLSGQQSSAEQACPIFSEPSSRTRAGFDLPARIVLKTHQWAAPRRRKESASPVVCVRRCLPLVWFGPVLKLVQAFSCVSRGGTIETHTTQELPAPGCIVGSGLVPDAKPAASVVIRSPRATCSSLGDGTGLLRICRIRVRIWMHRTKHLFDFYAVEGR